MVDRGDKHAGEALPDEKKPSVKPVEEQKAPSLSASFFLDLIDAPACKSKGYCDNCGRCEH